MQVEAGDYDLTYSVNLRHVRFESLTKNNGKVDSYQKTCYPSESALGG